jgi:hypothetical protein
MPVIRAALLAAVVALIGFGLGECVNAAHAQQPRQPVPLARNSATPLPPVNTTRCIKDSFGNFRCTDGTTILPDSNGGFTIIPPRK